MNYFTHERIKNMQKLHFYALVCMPSKGMSSMRWYVENEIRLHHAYSLPLLWSTLNPLIVLFPWETHNNIFKEEGGKMMPCHCQQTCEREENVGSACFFHWPKHQTSPENKRELPSRSHKQLDLNLAKISYL